jgi:hypothetical protein
MDDPVGGQPEFIAVNRVHDHVHGLRPDLPVVLVDVRHMLRW